MTPTLKFAKSELRWDGGSVYLTPLQRRLLVSMVRPRWEAECTVSETIEAAYPDPDKEPEDANGSLRVILHRLRRKIEPSGLRVTTRYGWGPHLSHDLNIDWRHA